MRLFRLIALCSLLVLTAATAAGAQPRPRRRPTAPPKGPVVVVKAARIETGSRGTVFDGAVVFQGGRIVSVGPLARVPKGAQVIDLKDGVLMPALVVANSRLGLLSGASGNDVTIAGDWLSGHPSLHRARAAGVGTLGLWPRSSGQLGVAVLAITPHDPKRPHVIRDAAGLRYRFSIGSSSKDGLTRLLEGALKAEAAAVKYAGARKIALLSAKRLGLPAPEADPKKDPAKATKSAPMVALARGALPLWLELGNASAVPHLEQVLAKFKGKKFKFVLRGGSDLWLAADVLARLKLPVVLATSFGGVARSQVQVNTAAELTRAGVDVVLLPHRDSATGLEEWRDRVGQLIRAGLPRDRALRAITSGPARLLGVPGRTGSIDKGAEANLVALTGDPFAPSSRITRVWIRGVVVAPGVKR